MDLLNKEQRSAIEIDSDVVIIAGPGTGKTRTLTHKIAYLINEKNIDPNYIAALTFTKKAAAEMKERVLALISKQAPNTNYQKSKPEQIPFIGTFHSLAYEIFKQQDMEPKIVSEKELAEIMREICGNYSSLCEQIGKNNLPRHISLYKTGFEFDTRKGFDELVDYYNSRLNKRGLIDYDDLLVRGLKEAEENSIKYEYILVDEFQDTNNLQYRLLRKLLGKKGNALVIGDPKQSIYSFRGSNEKIFDKFKADFPDAKEILLKKNYRSGRKIIRSSSALFKDSTELIPNKDEDGAVKLIETYNQYSEAGWILKQVNEKVGGIDLNYAAGVDLEKQTSSFADFAVVYRIHSLNKSLEKKFYEFGIPFQVIGSQSIYEQKEIRFIILALESLISNTEDTEDYLVLMHELKAVDESISLIKDKIKEIDANRKLSELVRQIVDLFSLEETLEDNNIKLQNLKEFVGSTLRFDKQEDGLRNFLEYIKYLEEHEYYDERADKVTLMSMHAAKGLEFPFVYIIGFEQGHIPYRKSIEEDNLDEERRLLYVAMTRAEEELQLLYTQRRYGKNAELSQFAKRLDEDNIQKIQDEEIKKIKRRIERSKKKQMDLF